MNHLSYRRALNGLGVIPNQESKLYQTKAIKDEDKRRPRSAIKLGEALNNIKERYGVDDILIYKNCLNRNTYAVVMSAEKIYKMSPRYLESLVPRRFNDIKAGVELTNIYAVLGFNISGMLIEDIDNISNIVFIPHPMVPTTEYYSVLKSSWYEGNPDQVIIPDICMSADPNPYGSNNGPVLIRSPAGILTNIIHTVGPGDIGKNVSPEFKKAAKFSNLMKVLKCKGIPWGSWSVTHGMHNWGGIVAFYADVSLLKENYTLTGVNTKKRKGITLTAWDSWTARQDMFAEIKDLSNKIMNQGGIGYSFLLSEYLYRGLDTSHFEQSDIRDRMFTRPVEAPEVKNWDEIDDALRNIVRARTGQEQSTRFRSATWEKRSYLELKFTDVLPLSQIPLAVTKHADVKALLEDPRSGFKGKVLLINTGSSGVYEFEKNDKDFTIIDQEVTKWAARNNRIISMQPSKKSGISKKFGDYTDHTFVTIPSGLMVGNTEVTQKLYKQITGKSPSEFTGDYNPVEKVSWYDAVDFCNRYTDYLNKFGWGLKHAYKDINGVIYWDKSVRGVRLPTVAEWNIYAKPNGVLYRGYLDEISWWLDNSMNRTHPVAFKKPNKYGLFDIVGNVSEWLWDEDKNNPLLRGIYLSDFLTFEEDNDDPKFIDPTSKRATIGFRVVI